MTDRKHPLDKDALPRKKGQIKLAFSSATSFCKENHVNENQAMLMKTFIKRH